MLATGGRVFLPASEFIVLPHLQQLETKSPLECIEWLIKGADDEVYLAVSATSMMLTTQLTYRQSILSIA